MSVPVSPATERRPRTFFQRFAWPILLVFLAGAPLVFYAASKTVASNSNKVEDWLPATFRETGELGWFRQYFAADGFLVISWDGCRLGDDPRKEGSAPDDPRIEKLANLLVADPPDDPTAAKSGSSAQGLGRYFKSVVTARSLLTQLTSEPTSLPYKDAVARLTGSMIGPDGHQTCVLVWLRNTELPKMRVLIGRGTPGPLGLRKSKHGVVFDALEACGIDPETTRLGGPPVDNAAIDEEGERTLLRLAGLAGLLGLTLAWWSLRSIKLTLIVFGCGIYSAAAGLAAVSLTGETCDAILLSMPSLIYVLAISGAVHLINYYHDAVEGGGLHGAPERALAHGWKPALLCSVTTALGLLSLYTSDLVPIRKFGIYSALGMVLLLAVLFLYLPAALQVWPVRKRSAARRSDQDELAPEHGFWARFGGWIIQHHVRVSFACIAVIATIGYGITRVETSIDLMKLFDGQARILQDYRWLETNVGRLVPMEIVVRFQDDVLEPRDAARADPTRLALLDRMEIVRDVQRVIQGRFGAAGTDVVGPSLSGLTFVPPLPTQRQGTSSVVRRAVTNAKLWESYGALLDSGYLQNTDDDGSELWRIHLRVAAFQDVDYGAFTQELQGTIEPILRAHRQRLAILARLQESRQHDRYAGAKVLVWRGGATRPAAVPAAKHSQGPVPDETKLLAGLLQRDRLQVELRDTEPLATSVTELKELQQFDCVALTGRFSAADLALVRAEIPAALAFSADPPRDPAASVSAVYTGVVPIVYKAQRALLQSLIESTFWSFVTITPLLMFVSRGMGAGLVAMVPNVLPVLIVFGGMGWLGLAVDIGAMMSASIALGVAVDDTIHYLTWFRDSLNQTGCRKQAILEAYRRCASPTLQAALISGLGLSVFAFSTFTPTQQFGHLMLTILLAGVVAELIMLPAVLAGPLGWVFRPSRRSPGALKASSSETGVPGFAASEHVLQASVAEDVTPVLPHLRANRKSSAFQP